MIIGLCQEDKTNTKTYASILNKVASIMEDLMVRATSGQGGRPAGNYIQFGTVNVGTISGTGNEVAKMLTCRKVYLCFLQETR